MVLCCLPFFARELRYDNTSPDYLAFPSPTKTINSIFLSNGDSNSPNFIVKTMYVEGKNYC